MSQLQTAPAAASTTKPASVAGADWRPYEGNIPPILQRMCRGKEVTTAMLHKAMSTAKNFLPKESKVPEGEKNDPWRDAIVCGWDAAGNRIMILIPLRDRATKQIEVRVKGDVTNTNVEVALRALCYGLVRVAFE